MTPNHHLRFQHMLQLLFILLEYKIDDHLSAYLLQILEFHFSLKTVRILEHLTHSLKWT